jgi:multicomponent Na+:H+ antiporter subunit C
MIETTETLFLIVGAILFAIGLRGVYREAESFRRIVAINVMGNGVFLIFVALASRGPDGQPDPVPHAMVLTGIVVAVCATGLALTLAELCARNGDDPPREEPP